MRKASGVLEVGLLLAFVAVIAVGVMTIYNSQKTNLAGLSQIHANPKAETAGGNAK